MGELPFEVRIQADDYIATFVKGSRSQPKCLYAKGDNLCELRPLIAVCNGKYSVCDHCFLPLNHSVECVCQIDTYCSMQCKRQAESSHAAECCLIQKCQLAKIFPRSDYLKKMPLFRVLIRLILRLTKNLTDLDCLHLLNKDYTIDMSSLQNEDITNDNLLLYIQTLYPRKMSEISLSNDALIVSALLLNCIKVVNVSAKTNQKDLDLASSFRVLFSKLCCNISSITGTDSDIGIGLFKDISYINHSCLPNCFAAFQGNILRLFAHRDVYENDELTIQYCDSRAPPKVRAHDLSERYFFQCGCTVCCDPFYNVWNRSFEQALCKCCYSVRIDASLNDLLRYNIPCLEQYLPDSNTTFRIHPINSLYLRNSRQRCSKHSNDLTKCLACGAVLETNFAEILERGVACLSSTSTLAQKIQVLGKAYTLFVGDTETPWHKGYQPNDFKFLRNLLPYARVHSVCHFIIELTNQLMEDLTQNCLGFSPLLLLAHIAPLDLLIHKNLYGLGSVNFVKAAMNVGKIYYSIQDYRSAIQVYATIHDTNLSKYQFLISKNDIDEIETYYNELKRLN